MPANARQSAADQDDTMIVREVPYQQAVIAVAPTVAVNIVPGVIGAAITYTAVLHPGAMLAVAVIALTTLVLGVMIGLRFARTRFAAA